ncbi:uncharacterized protein BDZ99DRAFT_510967 [Mytilinidion resinicola]|uniref:Uncharacterized protein n=1 Tax=Mytilinidion resinicola TaxID=574789 RepID=A0A6A6YE12_9PEZI|nr:uncharacterized protein BDZ99DRAFT_510967 [Mytilinidion resinicola]KAF2806087.1 hypothetical protein BDZ99DRAFT_510967 [Mytilinidion resinicola]
MPLSATGLIALADLSTLSQRTALTGTSTLLDCLVLAPGIHRQQTASALNGGEYPAVAAMTSGYVFRVENPATSVFRRFVSALICTENTKLSTYLAYVATVSATLATLAFVVLSEDHWGVLVMSLLILCRFVNTTIIRRRSAPGWFGVPEAGVDGDLLVLLSQDRWVRIRGAVDDLKAVTSGQWLRDPTTRESYATASATLLLYATAVLTSNVSDIGKILVLGLLVGSVGVMALFNTRTEVLQMHGRLLKVDGERRVYKRRLEMAEELIKEVGREDWAIRLGMINRPAKESEGMPTM